jgi:GNAT superfamily N-acetyltransferase
MITDEVAAQVTILPVPVADLFSAPNSADLHRSYATECLVPNAQPQFAIYSAMEQAGVLKCFAAYVYPQSDNQPVLIGFLSLLCTVMPHNGKRWATVESVFVDPVYRSTGAGNSLLDHAERYAQDSGCLGITGTARVGSAFDTVLSHRPGYALTHSQHTRWFA